LQVIAPVERQLDNLFLINHGAERRVFGRYDRRDRRDLDLFGDRSRHERDVNARALSGFEREALNGLLEPRLLDGQRIIAGRELRNGVIAIVAGLDHARFVRAGVGDRDFGPGHDRARRVNYAARHGGANALRECVDRERGNRDQHGKQHWLEKTYSVFHRKPPVKMGSRNP
jgi:hypothetical protein